MVFQKGKLFLCPLAAVLLPSLQSIIWIIGSSLSRVLRDQFAYPGIDDGIVFTHIVAGVAQFFIGGILGFLTGLAYSFPPTFRRLLLCCGGLVGVSTFGYLLNNSWNFAANHCSPTVGCYTESSIPIDFVHFVFNDLPLVWCATVLFASIAMHDEKPSTNQ